jgi:hypothetical protein
MNFFSNERPNDGFDRKVERPFEKGTQKWHERVYD